MSDPAVKTTPHLHQAKIYDDHRDSQWFGLLWEMGLGKSKTISDVASHLFFRGKIQGLLIVAPNSVYAEWVNELLPTHMAAPHVKLCFRTDEHGDKRAMRRALFLNPGEWSGKLRVLCMSYDGVKSQHGSKLAADFVLLYKTMIVADESTALKNPETQTAKAMKRLRAGCHYAWIATGTPIAQSPFDFHSQVEFLCPDFWKKHGMKSFGAFRQQFGIYELRRAGARAFNTLVEYRDLTRLYAMIRPFCSRLTKEDSGVKLPPKTYRTISFRMTTEQRRVYDDLRKEFLAELDSGAIVEAPLAVVRLTRLQQIASGFVTAVDETSGLEQSHTWSLEDGEVRAAAIVDQMSGQEYDQARSDKSSRVTPLSASWNEGEVHIPCGVYLGDNDATCPQLTCVRNRGHEGLCDNVCDEESIDALIERSSFGDPLTKQIRSMTLPDVTAVILARAAELSAAQVVPRHVTSRVTDVVPPDKNPRLRLLVDLVEQASHKVVVWCRFVRDVDNVCAALGKTAVRYDGSVKQKDRLTALAKFRDPADDTRVLVANVHSISQGVTLTIAKTMVYYSNSFSPEKRLQSEDRNHRIGQDVPVLIVDLMAEDTVDEKLIDGLRKKFDLSAAVMGDRYREWLQPVRRGDD
jgi:SNF2 family DNA or RNA helicase